MDDAIEREWSTAELGDFRRTRRAQRVGARWAADPTASFPKMMGTDGELEGLYGLVENDAVDPRELFAAHARATRDRIDESARGREVLVIEDTTIFEFGGLHRRDVGWVSREKQGFFAHFALAVAADGSGRPLGVVGLMTHMRKRPAPLMKRPISKWNGKRTVDPKRESLRWNVLADETSDFLRGYAIPIHVTDRESDSYLYIADRIAKDQRFVLRAKALQRPVTLGPDFTDKTKLRLVAEQMVPIAERPAKLATRRTSKLSATRKTHPTRTPRVARLEFAAQRIRIDRQRHIPEELPLFLDVNLVHVRELEPPPECEPIEWFLLTSQPIETAEDVLRVVDHYRARWTIEEFNKAIKTGCRYESRQLESMHALLVALALCVPIAWQMLALRAQSRSTPDAPATDVMSSKRIACLRTVARRGLSKDPTVHEIFMAVAALGGHLPRNGPPGWQTLRAGLDTLLTIEAAFEARDAEQSEPERSGEC